MDTFHYEMSMYWFMNFQNVYWHGKVHSGNHCSTVGFWEFLFERSKVQFFSSNAFSLRCFQGWCSIESPLVFTSAAFWFETSSALGNVFTSQCKRFQRHLEPDRVPNWGENLSVFAECFAGYLTDNVQNGPWTCSMFKVIFFMRMAVNSVKSSGFQRPWSPK